MPMINGSLVVKRNDKRIMIELQSVNYHVTVQSGLGVRNATFFVRDKILQIDRPIYFVQLSINKIEL